jgi:hypothetical protein
VETACCFTFALICGSMSFSISLILVLILAEMSCLLSPPPSARTCNFRVFYSGTLIDLNVVIYFIPIPNLYSYSLTIHFLFL